MVARLLTYGGILSTFGDVIINNIFKWPFSRLFFVSKVNNKTYQWSLPGKIDPKKLSGGVDKELIREM